MSSKTKGENEKSSQPQFLLTSLPDDLVVDILAHVPRQDYPSLSLVSKQFQSIVTSHEIYTRRSLLRCTENSLYVILSSTETPNNGLYILRRKAHGHSCLVHIPSLSDFPNGESCVTVGSMIYVFGAEDDCTSSRAISIDCRSHTVQPLPNMPIPMSDTCAGFLDGKVYVFVHCSMKLDVMVVFNTETQTWEPGVIKPDTTTTVMWECGCMTVMADKIYMKYVGNKLIYDPKESKWQTDEVLNSKEWDDGGACVVDDVLYYYDSDENCLNRYDPKERRWGVVKGLDVILAVIRLSYWRETVRYGRNLALCFCIGEEKEPSGKTIRKIWCAEISLGRRQGNDIWGKVEWCDEVLTAAKYISVKSLGVIV